MAMEPDSHLLAQFRWTSQRGEFLSEEDGRIGGICESSTESPLPPQRQDDERVRTIQTSPEDLLERDMGKQHLQVQQSKHEDEEIICSETVYIAQLRWRALILDQTFKKKVVDSLALTRTESSDTVVATGIEQRRRLDACEGAAPASQNNTETPYHQPNDKSANRKLTFGSVVSNCRHRPCLVQQQCDFCVL